ncbi:hypothetical protein V5S96_11015 [Corynebacterium mastitidis]|uniref:HTH cro/C1-type domain-containing protein n=1 Tax=Corynebacterium mastitidis TaxID=161890 RepID=A0ABU8P2Y8_9CORY
MDQQIAWFSSAARRKITVTEIGEALGVSRNTARSRLDARLSSDDVITLSRALGVNPAIALEELQYLDTDELLDWSESDGKLVSTASDSELAMELARRLNPATLADALADIARAPERLKNLDGQDVARALLLLQQEITRRTDGLNTLLKQEGEEPITEQQALHTLADVDDLAARRERHADGGDESTPAATAELYAADSSLDETEERWERGEDPID